MIPPVPLNAALVVANLSQPLDELIYVRSEGERHYSFDVCDTVEFVEGSGEHFGGVGRSDQRICFVGASKEVAGESSIRLAAERSLLVRERSCSRAGG